MAALLGTNTALLLFQDEQAKQPDNVREIALAIIAAALPLKRFTSSSTPFCSSMSSDCHLNGSKNSIWPLRCAR